MIIIRDTREKAGKGWIFNDRDLGETVTRKLDTGDYSIEGLEDQFCIERKGSVVEWAGNVIQKRFVKELERMSKMDHPYILLEFNMDEMMAYPPPYLKRKGVKITGAFILKKTLEFQLKYGVHILFVGNSGRKVAKHIFSSFKGEAKDEI